MSWHRFTGRRGDAAFTAPASVVFAFVLASCANQGTPGSGSSEAGATPAAPAASAGGPGFIGRVTATVSEIGGGNLDDKPMLAKLKRGEFVKSNEAIGDDKDVNDKRVSHGLIALPRLSSYANGILDKLKTASGVTNVAGRVLIAANDQLDAGATADANIYISIGYFRSLENEDQLAALLGHELSHVLLHHHDSSWFARKQKELMSNFEDFSLVRNSLEAFASGKSTTTTALTPQQKTTLDRMALLVKLNDRALGPAWNRRQEQEADRLGADLMMQAGYSFADGMLPWLAKVAEWDAQQEAARKELVAQRQAAVEALAKEGKLQESAKVTMDGAMKDTLEEIARAHDGGEKRLAEMDVYVTKAHLNNIPGKRATVAPYKTVLQAGDVRTTIEAYRQAFDARNQIVNGKYSAALPILKRLTSSPSPIAAHALPNYLTYEAQRGLGRPADGEAELRMSLSAEEPTWEPYESSVTYYGDKDRRETVVEVGRTALTKFSAAPSAYPRLIALYVHYGLKDEAAKVVTECRRTQAQMRRVCEKAAKPSN